MTSTNNRPEGAGSTTQALPSDRLYRAADLSELRFSTTADLPPVEGLAGQHRVLDSIRLGMRMNKPGFNLFVIGSPGARMQQSIKDLIKASDGTLKQPNDWVYVNNFAEHHKPVAIQLPAGRAPQFREAMQELIADLQTAIPAVFESEDYQTRRGAIDEMFHKQQSDAFSAVRDNATRKGIVIVRTPFGFALAPARNGQVVPPEEFNRWPEATRKEVQDSIRELEKELEHIVRQVPQWEKARRDEIRRLDREVAKIAVAQLIDEAKANLVDIPRVLEHFESVRNDLIENVGLFLMKDGESEGDAHALSDGVFDRYRVNVLVTRSEPQSEPPIVDVLHPTLSNLIGRIEYVVREGVLVTNFLLIKSGALHLANGGYLLVNIRSLLSEPFSWTALKRVLKQREIKIEDIAHFMGLTSTVSLEPDPIPLDTKVILFGERLLYFLLMALDPETEEHFKLLADFEDDIDRTPENEALIARLLGSLANQHGLKALDRDAVLLTIEYAARLAGHSEKMTLLVDRLLDVMTEAGFYAAEAGHAVIGRAHVERAIEQRIHRAARIRDRLQEAVQKKVLLIDTAGSRVGQINGLNVFELAGSSFGSAARITCRVRPGAGKVVDIEREVELGGPVHSKGVLILSGFLAGRYALDTPMSLYASLVFEQSYGAVEGDSASSAELYALLSALSDAPLRQDLAVTGSVNQHGEIQAIGGINEKIEGFFDICRARGLSGSQGVLIPQANVQHLMLRRDVVEACTAGRFAIYPVATIDEGIALLTGRAAGERGADGLFPAASVNRLVEDRLRAFAAVRRQFQPGSVSRADDRSHG
jgi:predicted ATP-dependent protease